MALSETTVQDKIEVVDMGGWKVICVRTATVISRDDVEVSRSFHRHVVAQQTIGQQKAQKYKPCAIPFILTQQKVPRQQH